VPGRADLERIELPDHDSGHTQLRVPGGSDIERIELRGHDSGYTELHVSGRADLEWVELPGQYARDGGELLVPEWWDAEPIKLCEYVDDVGHSDELFVHCSRRAQHHHPQLRYHHHKQ
jgi:hypothetical protein